MVLKDSFGFWVVAINFVTCNDSFTPVTTSVVVDVNMALPRFILQPASRLDPKTAFWENSFSKADPGARIRSPGQEILVCECTS